MGVATTRAPNGLGPPNSSKMLAHWVDFLGQTLSRKYVFEIFRVKTRPFKILSYSSKINDILITFVQYKCEFALKIKIFLFKLLFFRNGLPNNQLGLNGIDG